MGIIHKLVGRWGSDFRWSGSRVRRYDGDAAAGVSETWLIGRAENACNFALRYYEVGPGGLTRLEQHDHDHGMIFLCGEGQVTLGDDRVAVTQGDVVYIPPNVLHQITNTGDDKLGFLCMIPAVRAKQDKPVWAEEDLNGLTTVE